MPPDAFRVSFLATTAGRLAAGYAVLITSTILWSYTKATPLLIVAAAAAVAVVADVTVRLWRRREHPLIPIVVLVLLPIWGLVYNHGGQVECRIRACDGDDVVFRPLAEPEVYGLLALHVLIALAYAVSRRRPAALRAGAEALLHALLVVGVVVHALLALHFARWLPAAALFPPLFVACAAPVMTVTLYAVELRARLVRRGVEAAARETRPAPDSAYREGPPQELLPPEPKVHRPALARALGLAPVVLGAHAVIQALWLGRPDAALSVVTGTCGYVLSAVPIEVLPGSCHYLCTVAARGHTWLVRPERVGRRGGVPIVVNRQLALANAFEDLLHERWPQFGRWARRIYDRVGLPVSRYLRRPLLADGVYLVMKPAEWLFYLFLLLADRGDPEARIDRMYR